MESDFSWILWPSAGFLIAGGMVGLLIGLSIVPRYAGITHTADQILLYEDVTLLGTVAGTIWPLFSLPIPFGIFFTPLRTFLWSFSWWVDSLPCRNGRCISHFLLFYYLGFFF